jgi:AcrR family transcriptional regulator
MERVLTAKGTATRLRIVEGSAALIRDRGPAQVGLDDIRALTSTSKSQLFHYFPEGKAALLLAVAEYEAEQVLADQQPMLTDLTTWRKWQSWRRRVVEKYDVQRERCPLSALTAQLGLADPATRAILIGLYDTWQGFLAVGVQALKDAGEIDESVNVGETATAILTAITGGATMLQATGRLSYLESALSEALDGMRRPGTRPPRR